MNNEQAIKEIEVSKKEAQRFIDKAAGLEQLAKNRHFNKLILEGYFKDEAARLTGLLGEPEFASEEHQRELFSQLKAISHLQQHFRAITEVGRQMRQAVDDMDAAIEEINAEEAEA
ncbi:conserved hypothetical protein [Alteromonas alvinellae]